MCFSTEVSFGASAILFVISVASFKKATTPAQMVVAGIPLFFAIQQAIEGVLWLSLLHGEYQYLYPFATHAFLSLALVIWPSMIPLVALLPEREPRRRQVLKVLLVAGVLVSLFHLYCLIIYGASASPQQQHILYEYHFPKDLVSLSSVIYFFPALIPTFLSSHRSVRWIGVGLVISYGFSWMFYHHNIISVWCFFATIISLVAFHAIVQLNDIEKDPKPEVVHGSAN